MTSGSRPDSSHGTRSLAEDLPFALKLPRQYRPRRRRTAVVVAAIIPASGYVAAAAQPGGREDRRLVGSRLAPSESLAGAADVRSPCGTRAQPDAAA